MIVYQMDMWVWFINGRKRFTNVGNWSQHHPWEMSTMPAYLSKPAHIILLLLLCWLTSMFSMCLVLGFSPQPWLLSHLFLQHHRPWFRNHSSVPGFWKYAHNKNLSPIYFNMSKKQYFFPVCSLSSLFFLWNSIFQLGIHYISWGYSVNHISF